MPSTNLAHADGRREDRDHVHHRTVAVTTAGRSVPVLVVNISPSGLMARCDQPIAPGTPVTFRLPGLAPLAAEVRWTLGGRMGCEFSKQIPLNSYFTLLPHLRG